MWSLSPARIVKIIALLQCSFSALAIAIHSALAYILLSSLRIPGSAELLLNYLDTLTQGNARQLVSYQVAAHLVLLSAGILGLVVAIMVLLRKPRCRQMFIGVIVLTILLNGALFLWRVFYLPEAARRFASGSGEWLVAKVIYYSILIWFFTSTTTNSDRAAPVETKNDY